MSAPRKYPDEMRERAVGLVRDIAEDAGSVAAACRRIGEQLGINADTLRGWVNSQGRDRARRRVVGHVQQFVPEGRNADREIRRRPQVRQRRPEPPRQAYLG